MPKKVFRFADRQEAAREHHLVELRNGRHYRMRTGAGDQPGDRAVRIHELAETINELGGHLTPEEVTARIEDGTLKAADSRLMHDSLAELVRLLFFEELPDDVLAEHDIHDLMQIVDAYFLHWAAPNAQPIPMVVTST